MPSNKTPIRLPSIVAPSDVAIGSSWRGSRDAVVERRRYARISARTKPPFRADHVGSFLRPAALLDARERNRKGEISRAQLREVEDVSIRDIVRFQEGLGLEGVTDGEFRRTYFHIDFLEQLSGIETKGGIAVSFHSASGNVDFAPPVMHITAPVRHVKPIQRDDFNFLRSVTKR